MSDKIKVGVIGRHTETCIPCTKDALSVSVDMCGVGRESNESTFLVLPNGYTKEEIEKLIIDHDISSDTIIGTLTKEGLFETIDGTVMELQRGFDINEKKEIVFPLTNPYKDMDFPSSSKKLKFKKQYWSKGKLKHK